MGLGWCKGMKVVLTVCRCYCVCAVVVTDAREGGEWGQQ